MQSVVPVDNHEWDTILPYDLGLAEGGINELIVIVRNYPGSSDPKGNPTGLVFKAEITYEDLGQINIDIKPGSYPNAININGNGVVPVAILGSADLDVSQIDPGSLSFGGLSVKTKKNGNLQYSIEDVSGDFTTSELGAPDGHDDLVCQFVDDDNVLFEGNGTAEVTGQLYDGTPIVGEDSIKLVNE